MPSKLATALTLYRDEGIGAVIGKVQRRLGRTGPRYQEKLGDAFDLRWNMIAAELPADAVSLLDMGSNLGAFTAAAARAGLWSIGVEKAPELAKQARVLNADVRDCAFVLSDVDAEALAKMPSFDVTLMLSVHHHWHQAYGPAVAARMLRDIVARTNKVLIFEGASRRGRFGRDLPDFVDNDEASLTAYYDAYLRDTVGDLVTAIKPLGKSPCVGEREPYRWMYGLVR